jgi:hypothetical protein
MDFSTFDIILIETAILVSGAAIFQIVREIFFQVSIHANKTARQNRDRATQNPFQDCELCTIIWKNKRKNMARQRVQKLRSKVHNLIGKMQPLIREIYSEN